MWVWKMRALAMGAIICVLSIVLMAVYGLNVGHITLLAIGLVLLVIGLVVKDKDAGKEEKA